MANIQENIERINSNVKALENHPMCLRVEHVTGNRLMVIMPEPIDGIDGFRIEKTSRAIEDILERLEKNWKLAYRLIRG